MADYLKILKEELEKEAEGGNLGGGEGEDVRAKTEPRAAS